MFLKTLKTNNGLGLDKVYMCLEAIPRKILELETIIEIEPKLAPIDNLLFNVGILTHVFIARCDVYDMNFDISKTLIIMCFVKQATDVNVSIFMFFHFKGIGRVDDPVF